MRLEIGLNMRQQMRLKLAPQIIQSIEILQLPLLELRGRIEQELLENPLLEADETDEQAEDEETDEQAEGQEESEVALEEPEPVEPLEEAPEVESDPISEENYDALADLMPEDTFEERRVRQSGDEKDPKLAALENSPAPDISLEEHLRRQLAYFGLEPDLRTICDNLVANLDWHGYLEYPLEEIIASIEEIEVTPEKAQEALAIVQQLEPPGVGARNLEECLLLQLDEREANYEFLKAIIDGHFQDIVRNRYPKVARALGCSIEELKEAVEQIGSLSPVPGALFGEAPTPHIAADLRIELVEGEYQVILEDSTLPSLRICSYYARRLQQEGLDAKTEEYLRKKLQSARWLIDAIQQRRSTIYNITSAIVQEQKEFFDKGPMHLKPLRMQEIADRVGVHVSTVSRALAGKYVQTPRGLYSLKRFFTGGVEKDNGEMESWEVVRQKLLNVVEQEDKSKPMSDEQLAAELGAQGIDIARRTVSKYRKLLNIPSSRQRRQY